MERAEFTYKLPAILRVNVTKISGKRHAKKQPKQHCSFKGKNSNKKSYNKLRTGLIPK